MKTSFIIVLLLSMCFPVFAEQTEPIDPNSMNVEQQGFWQEVFWGTSVDPGILRSVFDWVVGLSENLLGNLLQAAFNAFSVSPDDYSTVMEHYAVANCWAPVSLAFTLLLARWAFLSVYVTYKLIIKHVPFIG